MKPWQKGYDLELLKNIAAPFKKDFEAHTYGAFGLPKERDIANALSTDECLYKKNGTAAAIFKILRVSSIQIDWAGRSIKPNRGDLFIKHICGDQNPTSQTQIILTLMERAGGCPTFIEIHEERLQAKQTVEALGFEWVMTKISASSDLKGVYFKGSASQKADRVFVPQNYVEDIAMAKIRKAFISDHQRKKILKEIDDFGDWAQHYSSYNKRHSWTAFAIQGYDENDPLFIQKPEEMSKLWKAENPDRLKASCKPTVSREMFKETWAVVDAIPGKKQRVRFMRLSKNSGELTRHADITDREAGVRDNMISRLHIPILTPKSCKFSAWSPRGEQIEWHWDELDLHYLDMRKPHRVINPGDFDRIHLVIDTYSNENLRRWLNDSLVAA